MYVKPTVTRVEAVVLLQPHPLTHVTVSMRLCWGAIDEGVFLFSESGQTGESGVVKHETVLGMHDNRSATRQP